MRKSILLLALGIFLSASVTANACDHDKACVKGTKASTSCTKTGKMKSSLSMTGKSCTDNPNCSIKDCSKASATCPVKNCPTPSKCGAGAKAMKTSTTTSATAQKF